VLRTHRQLGFYRLSACGCDGHVELVPDIVIALGGSWFLNGGVFVPGSELDAGENLKGFCL
jgi:hypothetical protein